MSKNEVCVPAIKLTKERLLEEREIIDKKIKALDIVLDMFDDGEDTKIREREENSTDIEKKREKQRKAYKRWYDKNKAQKEQKTNSDIEVEKSIDLPAAKKKNRINYEDMA